MDGRGLITDRRVLNSGAHSPPVAGPCPSRAPDERHSARTVGLARVDLRGVEREIGHDHQQGIARLVVARSDLTVVRLCLAVRVCKADAGPTGSGVSR